MTHTVKLKSGKYSFQADAYESILDAAIREGVPLNYGCSNGNCGMCKAKIVLVLPHRYAHMILLFAMQIKFKVMRLCARLHVKVM